ncbi:MAG: ATP-binding cassette domain-containing protein [Alphaproteobacteria bacterium]|nr:ATP-binding cassette domain-containing protein [Alphaproteobacteria bacterium]
MREGGNAFCQALAERPNLLSTAHSCGAVVFCNAFSVVAIHLTGEFRCLSQQVNSRSQAETETISLDWTKRSAWIKSKIQTRRARVTNLFTAWAAMISSMVSAAKMAGVHDMILHLPNGYETNIGEDGELLSGGQRQRIALARALLGPPRLLMLDEPNANLDTFGDEALLNALTEAKDAGITTVVVSHRPALLQKVDKMLVLRDGVVRAFGTPDEVTAGAARPGRLLDGGAKPRPNAMPGLALKKGDGKPKSGDDPAKKTGPTIEEGEVA